MEKKYDKLMKENRRKNEENEKLKIYNEILFEENKTLSENIKDQILKLSIILKETIEMKELDRIKIENQTKVIEYLKTNVEKLIYKNSIQNFCILNENENHLENCRNSAKIITIKNNNINNSINKINIRKKFREYSNDKRNEFRYYSNGKKKFDDRKKNDKFIIKYDYSEKDDSDFEIRENEAKIKSHNNSLGIKPYKFTENNIKYIDKFDINYKNKKQNYMSNTFNNDFYK